MKLSARMEVSVRKLSLSNPATQAQSRRVGSFGSVEARELCQKLVSRRSNLRNTEGGLGGRLTRRVSATDVVWRRCPPAS
mmetsp:Transcript_50526/g.105553  ORF Transcript_50526/g.105553 Transcript_50526/m.105553 type:complete len:80 (+) Transcript_50526:3704-3943(+)